MLQQKQGDAQIFCHSFDVKVERWLARYAKLTMPTLKKIVDYVT
jgi:hypothetical protein